MNTRLHLDVVIPGAQKAGTSSLLSALGSHSQVVRHRTEELGALVTPDVDLATAIHKEFPDTPEAKLLLAKSAGVMHADGALERLHAHNPRIRLVFMLRDPVARVQSAYWFARLTGDEVIPAIGDALAAEDGRTDVPDARRPWVAYRARSQYLEPLQQAAEIFGRDQLKILLLENYRADRNGALRELQEWLGLTVEDLSRSPHVVNASRTAGSAKIARLARSTNPATRLARRLLPITATRTIRRGVIRMNERQGSPPPLEPAQQQELAGFFADHNRRLAEAFDLDLSKWS